MTATSESSFELISQSFGLKMCQRTLARPVSASGVGLFSGQQAQITFIPAVPGHGIVFQRVDLPNKPKIAACLDSVCGMPRCTALGKGVESIQTVEHLLSALYALSVDNLLIEISGPEVPIFDGSSTYFVQMLQEAGLFEQKENKNYYTLAAPAYWSQGDVHLVALPSATEYRVSYTLSYPSSKLLHSQFCSIAVTEQSYMQELSPCRTFSVYEEIKPFIDKGLLKGGSLENAVLIQEDRVVNPEGLRFSNEMVRHKVLDLIGDFSLIGRSLLVHIVAIRSGHASNIAFAKELAKQLVQIELK